MDSLDRDDNPLSISAEELAHLLRNKIGSGNNIDGDKSYTETGLLGTTLSEDAEARDAIAAWILAQQEYNQSVDRAVRTLGDAVLVEKSRVSKLFKYQHLFNISCLLILALVTGKILLVDNITDRLWNVLDRAYSSGSQLDRDSPIFIQPDRKKSILP